MPVLSHLAQIYEPPSTVIDEVERLRILITKTPGSSIPKTLFFQLNRFSPLPSPTLFSALAMAIRVRVLVATLPGWPRYKNVRTFGNEFNWDQGIVIQYRESAWATLSRSYNLAKSKGVYECPILAPALCNLVRHKPQTPLYVFFCPRFCLLPRLCFLPLLLTN